MPTRSITVVDDDRVVAVEAAVEGEEVRVAPAAMERGLGWRLESEGLCRGDVCVPVRDSAALVSAAGVDLAALARLLDRPLALDVEEGMAVLGASAAERAAHLASLEAPDFVLPDLAGRRHALRDRRGKKTLLIAWASW